MLCATLIAFFLLFPSGLTALPDDVKPAPSGPELAAADQLFRTGKFADAESRYQAILEKDPKLVPAQVGLLRSMLRQQKIDDLLDIANNMLEKTNSAALLAVKGDIQFRRGEMSDAEISYFNAKKADSKEVHSYLGLARLYSSYSLYRKAYDELQAAHSIAPDDIEVQQEWLRMLPRRERMVALESYLSGAHPDDEEETRWMQEYLDFLKATVDKPVHACRLVSEVEQTGTKLEVMYAADARRMRGLGLSLKINDQHARLLLDTGAGSILISRKIAEKAGLTRISSGHLAGIGDKGLQGGYSAVADHIQIGDLDFHDCVVRVSDANSVVEEDGLIGADVFSAYLVDIDFPGMRLKLSPLPKRPEDAVAPKSLNSEGEEQANAERKEESVSEPGSGEQKQSAPVSMTPQRLPKDAYIAPEMAKWTKVFRFGHTMLVPTFVNDSPVLLFELDTGMFANVLSLRAGQQVIGKVSSNDSIRVRGVNGEVKKVYSARATLRFGHLQQPNMQVVTLDLSSQSRLLGTELSGFLGFDMLKVLEVKLDYRDGLVDFAYDPNRVPIR